MVGGGGGVDEGVWFGGLVWFGDWSNERKNTWRQRVINLQVFKRGMVCAPISVRNPFLTVGVQPCALGSPELTNTRVPDGSMIREREREREREKLYQRNRRERVKTKRSAAAAAEPSIPSGKICRGGRRRRMK